MHLQSRLPHGEITIAFANPNADPTKVPTKTIANGFLINGANAPGGNTATSCNIYFPISWLTVTSLIVQCLLNAAAGGLMANSTGGLSRYEGFCL